jgi:PAS domain S-box-containing protein
MSVQTTTGRMAMLAAIIESSDDAIISKRLDGIITSWNNGAENIFGYSESEAIGQHISLIIPKDRLKEEEMIISQLKQGKRIEHYQTNRITKSGKEVILSLSISPIHDETGKVIGASKIARDITKQKEAEKLIEQYVYRLELLNVIGKTLSAELDTNIILQKVTDATTELSGAAFGAFFYNKADSKGDSYLLYAISGAPREAFEKLGMPRNTAIFETTFNGLGILRSDDITKDPRYGKNSPYKGMPAGHLPVVSYLAVPVFSPTGIVIGGLFFGHPKPAMFTEEHEKLVESIANQAAISLENARLYQEVQKFSAKKDEFIGFASHELRTPLTTITGYLQIVEESPDLIKHVLPKLKKQVARLVSIISDLLDISKIQADKFELNQTSISLRSLIKESVDSARHLSTTHEIEYKIPNEELFLYVDATKMNQVLLNILSNAIKYSPNNKVIMLNAERFGDEVKISITDHGKGIAKEHLEQVFTQFYRVAPNDSQTEGLGLGLYLCKEYVEAHHGKIWVESEVGIGTTMHLTLPIKKI